MEVDAFMLQPEYFIKLGPCVVLDYNGVSSIAEFKVDAGGCLYRSDCYALKDETFAN
jgi:hypothetical protein